MPGDACDQQAEQVAERVADRTHKTAGDNPEAASPKATNTLHRAPARPKNGPPPVSAATAHALAQQSDTGQPLPDPTRMNMERAIGADLSAVQIHSGEAAGELAHNLGARAFTVRDDIFFAPGEFAPQTDRGRHLLAHELTHVRQQRQGSQPAIQRTPGDKPVWVNTSTGVYHPPESRFYGKTTRGQYMSVAQAEKQGFRAAGSKPTAHSGVYSVQRPSKGEPRIVIDAWLGSPQKRMGTESQFARAAEYGLEEIEGWERAHSQSAGTGAESGEAIRLAPKVVNQGLQNQGIEGFMRDLEAAKPKGTKLHLRTVTKTHPGTLRLKEIHYEVSAKLPGEDKRRTIFRTVIRVHKDGTAQAGTAWAGSDEYEWTPRYTPKTDTGKTSRPGTTPTTAKAAGRAARILPSVKGVKHRVRANLGRLRIGIKGIGGGFRRVGGRGIGVIVSLALGFLIGHLEGKRQERWIKAKGRAIEKSVVDTIESMQEAAIAMRVRHPDGTIYLQVTTTFSETSWAAYGGGFDVVEGTDYDLELDSVYLGTTEDNSSYSHSDGGGGGQVTHNETTTTSTPLTVADVPRLEDLQTYLSQREALHTIARPSVRKQFMAIEISKLRDVINAYEIAKSAKIRKSSLQMVLLYAYGTTVLSYLDKLAEWQNLQDEVLTATAGIEESMFELADQIVAPMSRKSLEESLMKEEYLALASVLQIHQSIATSATNEDDLRNQSQILIHESKRAQIAGQRRREFAVADTYIASRLLAIEQERNTSSQSTYHDLMLQEEEATLLKIRSLEEKALDSTVSALEREGFLQERDELIAEVLPSAH